MPVLSLGQHHSLNADFPTVAVPRGWGQMLSFNMDDIAAFPALRQIRQPRLNDAAVGRAWSRPAIGRLPPALCMTECWPRKPAAVQPVQEAITLEWQQWCALLGKRQPTQMQLHVSAHPQVFALALADWLQRRDSVSPSMPCGIVLYLGQADVPDCSGVPGADVMLRSMAGGESGFHALCLTVLPAVLQQAGGRVGVELWLGQLMDAEAMAQVHALLLMQPARFCLRGVVAAAVSASQLLQQKEQLYQVLQWLDELGYGHLAGGWFTRADDPWRHAQRLGRLMLTGEGDLIAEDGEWIGLGPGASTLLGAVQGWNSAETAYLKQLQQGKRPLAAARKLSLDILMRRAMAQQLLCLGYLDFMTFELTYMVQFEQYFATELKQLQGWIKAGYLLQRHRTLWLTESGRLLADQFARYFLHA